MTPPGSTEPAAAHSRDAPGGGVVFQPPPTWPFWGLTVALFGLGLAFWRPIPVGVWHDDGVYMLIGEALSRGEGLRYVGVPGDLPAVKFPPLYSMLLGALWVVFGAVGPVTLAAELLNLALVAGAGGLLAWALHRGSGLRRREAVLLAGIAFASADVWRPALVPLSEPLFMALAAAAFAAWCRAADPDDRRGLAWLAAVLTAAVLARSAAVSLVAGCGAAVMVRRGWKPALVAVTPALGATLAWGSWAAARGAEIPEGLRDVLGGYGGWLVGQLLAAPAAFLQGLPAHAEGIASRVFALLLPGLSGWPLWAAAVPLFLAGAVGWWRLVRTFPPLAWSAAAYVAMLLLWPFVDRRLVAPLHPWVAICVGVGALEGMKRLPSPPLRRTAAALAFAWVVAYSAVTAGRAARGWAVAGYQLRAGRLAAAVEVLRNTAPPDAVVGAPEFWAALHLHGGWQVVPSARFTPRADDDDTPVWGTPMEQLSLWWGAGMDHLLLEQGGVVHGAALDLVERHCPGAITTLARMPPQVVVRLDWDQACATALGLTPGPPG